MHGLTTSAPPHGCALCIYSQAGAQRSPQLELIVDGRTLGSDWHARSHGEHEPPPLAVGGLEGRGIVHSRAACEPPGSWRHPARTQQQESSRSCPAGVRIAAQGRWGKPFAFASHGDSSSSSRRSAHVLALQAGLADPPPAALQDTPARCPPWCCWGMCGGFSKCILRLLRCMSRASFACNTCLVC